jgi:hypothetical protein
LVLFSFQNSVTDSLQRTQPLFLPLFLLDPVFSLFYTPPVKRKFLSIQNNSNNGSAVPGVEPDDTDLSLLEESLRLTPWERMLANDDALNFADSLRAAMKRRHAEP